MRIVDNKEEALEEELLGEEADYEVDNESFADIEETEESQIFE